MVALAGKVSVKAVAVDTSGANWGIQTLWHGTALSDELGLPALFGVKARHGGSQNIFVRDTNRDWELLRSLAPN
ncbi:hypothetical protein [Sphingorhabdus sp.]|uniref:hypothetical protein n=1 Tax=Sphingorhabdus sp. TaxID=1902408 RepID=UPI00391B77C4